MPLRKASIQDDGTILCYGNGIRCITPTVEPADPEFISFAIPRSTSPIYDETLVELSRKINNLIAEACAKRKQPELKLGLLITTHGVLLVWKRELNSTQDVAQFTSVESLIDLDDMSDSELTDFLHLEFDRPSS